MFIAGTRSLIHYLDGNCNVIDLHDPIDENFSMEKCSSSKPLKVEQQPGLKIAKEYFENGINNSKDMITDIYQAKRIQKWLE